MRKLLTLSRKTILFAGSLGFALFAMIVVFSVKTSTQQLQIPNHKDKDVLLRQIEDSPGQLLRSVGNDDCPFRIVEANVKEIPGSQFTKLTGRTTDLVTVSSVPEVKLVNTSEKTITGFVLAIRDPQSRTTRVIVQQKASVLPGGTYTIKREDFVEPEQLTVADGNGRFHQTRVQPKMDSEKYWVQFAGRADIFITVGRVSFDDGSIWKIKEGGEVR